MRIAIKQRKLKPGSLPAGKSIVRIRLHGVTASQAKARPVLARRPAAPRGRGGS